MSTDETSKQLAGMQRALTQVGLRLNKLLELAEQGAGRPDAAPDAPGLDLVLDLLAAVERTLELAARPAPPLPWWQQQLGVRPAPALDLTGLTLAREQAVSQLALAGLHRSPTAGPLDPRLHQVVEVQATHDPALHNTIARLHVCGWHRSGSPPTVVRLAQVSAWRASEPTS